MGLGFVEVELFDFSKDFLEFRAGLVKKEEAAEWIEELKHSREAFVYEPMPGIVVANLPLKRIVFKMGEVRA